MSTIASVCIMFGLWGMGFFIGLGLECLGKALRGNHEQD